VANFTLPLHYVILTLSVFFLLLIGNRGPALELIVLFIFLFHMSRHGKVSFYLLFIYAVVLIFFLGLLNLYRQGDQFDLQLLLLKSLWRPYVNIDNFNLVLGYFKEFSIPVGKGYLIDISVLSPGYQPNFGTWFKEAAGLEFTGGGVTVTYAGEIVSNFGVDFLFAISFIYFAFIYMVSSFLKKRFSMYYFIVLLVSSITIKSIVSSGLVSPIIYVFVPFLFVLFAIELTAFILQKSLRV
jgi:hypothetical protein